MQLNKFNNTELERAIGRIHIRVRTAAHMYSTAPHRTAYIRVVYK